jgi:hypothetical protein
MLPADPGGHKGEATRAPAALPLFLHGGVLMRLIKGVASVLVALALVVVSGAEASGRKGKDKDCRWIWITGLPAAGVELVEVPTGYVDLMNLCYGTDFAAACQFWWANVVTGTASGTWVMCGNETWGVTTNPSGLPLTGAFWTNPSFVLTKHGALCLAEQSVGSPKGDFMALEEVIGGTGIYAGMTGWLANQRPITATTKRFSFAGWICRP